MATAAEEAAMPLAETLFGIPLSTHRDRSLPLSAFPYEIIIAAISIAMFRTTIPAMTTPRKEPWVLRWCFGILLAFLTYTEKSYEVIVAFGVFSYAVPLCLFASWPLAIFGLETTPSKSSDRTATSIFIRMIFIFIAGLFAMAFSHVLVNGTLYTWFVWALPDGVSKGIASVLPTEEMTAAYQLLGQFVTEPNLLDHQIARLFFITFHIQCGIGYLGIDFLKQEQQRRNELVRMDMTRGSLEDDDMENDEATPTQNNGEKNSLSKGKSDVQMQRRMKKSRNFQRTAGPFILYTAVPYMIKIIAYGNLNAFAFTCFKDDVHRSVRLYELFEHENHLVAVAEHSATSPEAYAGYMDTIVSTTYDIFNRKLFSLPKVMLLPTVMARQPRMMAQIFPIIFFSDWVKGRAVAYMTSRIEQLQKEIQELTAVRSKVESFDMKNAELLQRAGAMDFTRRKWEELTVKVQMKSVVKDLTARTKGFFAFIQRNFVFTVLVDCALAHLIAVGKLVAADVFVFSRAIEDAVDMALMKSRSEAELARMMTQIENMKELASVWENAQGRNLIHCNKAPTAVLKSALEKDHSSLLVLRNLIYSRGTALVRADHLELEAGIYALTGGNGSGKSTLFRVLMACDTNERGIDLPPSIVLSTPNDPIIEEDDLKREESCEAAEEEDEETGTATDVAPSMSNEAHPRLSITMPSSRVVEISQTFYWPLYSKPMDWISQEYNTGSGEDCSALSVRRVAEELHSLEFAQAPVESTSDEQNSESQSSSETIILGIMEQLVEEKEDWFGDLSGGQRSKVELVRKVFLQETCPEVLLVDETMAPLDPKSKSLVMGKLKDFCRKSVVIVIYHTDVGRETEGEAGTSVECVPSNNFFDGNIHVENKTLHIRPVC